MVSADDAVPARLAPAPVGSRGVQSSLCRRRREHGQFGHQQPLLAELPGEPCPKERQARRTSHTPWPAEQPGPRSRARPRITEGIASTALVTLMTSTRCTRHSTATAQPARAGVSRWQASDRPSHQRRRHRARQCPSRVRRYLCGDRRATPSSGILMVCRRRALGCRDPSRRVCVVRHRRLRVHANERALSRVECSRVLVDRRRSVLISRAVDCCRSVVQRGRWPRRNVLMPAMMMVFTSALSSAAAP